MSDIEAIIALILLFMGVPDLCRKLGRPALIYPVFVLCGIALGMFADQGVRGMLIQAGNVGFLLLLFEVGLEIDLPSFEKLRKPLRFVAIWSVLQYPIVLAFCQALELPFTDALIAAAVLTSCSVGMSHAAWKSYPGLDEERKTFLLHVMVLLEVLAIALLSVETVAFYQGVGWTLAAKLAGIALVVLAINGFSVSLTKLFNKVLAMTTNWRVHLIVLLVLAVCAVGERLGLSAAKTAFFLGLFMSHITHDGAHLENFIAPISQRFLIPVFFVGLGLQIPAELLVSNVALVALALAIFLLAYREMIFRRWLGGADDRNVFLLFCPNLTIAALAAKTFIDYGGEVNLAGGLLLCGLFLSVLALFALPRPRPDPAISPLPKMD